MQEISGVITPTSTPYSEFKNHIGEVVTIKGAIHNIRDMSDFAFIIVRTARELIQCVYSPEFSDFRLNDNVVEQAAAKLTGKVVKSETRDGSERYELQIHDIEILSKPADIPRYLAQPQRTRGIQNSGGYTKRLPRVPHFTEFYRNSFAQNQLCGRGGRHERVQTRLLRQNRIPCSEPPAI